MHLQNNWDFLICPDLDAFTDFTLREFDSVFVITTNQKQQRRTLCIWYQTI
jgi:hypothetical protein